MYNSFTNTWTRLLSADRQSDPQALYTFMFVLPDGNLVDAGPFTSRILLTSTWTWAGVIGDPTWPQPQPPATWYEGSAVMYEPGKIMRCGGRARPPNPPYPAVDTTWVVDLSNANPSSSTNWLLAGAMGSARAHHNLVVLPDGKILAVGGNRVDSTLDPVYEAEMFDPAAMKWSDQPAMDHPRWYHSTAMLLADGRVVSAGGDSTPTAQIFKPAYIDAAPRPILLNPPPYMGYGQWHVLSYDRNGGNLASSVCLIRLASVTHGFDMDQRRVPLEIVGQSTEQPGVNQVIVAAPANANLAPPGYYMLFVLSEYAANQYAPCTLAGYVQVGP